MFLLRPKIFALTRFAQPKHVTIKSQTRLRIRDSNRSMIDTEEEVIGLFLPTRIAFARRKIDDLDIVLIRIAKIERFDSGSSFNRGWQRLWTGRNELHLQCPQ